MHSLRVSSFFFFTNNIGASHSDTLGHTKFLLSNSSNRVFSSFNSARAILYGGLDIGIVPGTSSLQKSISLFGGIPSNSSENTSTNSHTTGPSAFCVLLVLSSTLVTIDAKCA